jgi:hypothetical protein
MKLYFSIISLLALLNVNGQLLAPFQPLQNQPKVQFDYWIYSTHAGNGSTSQYPANATSKVDMDNIFNSNNSNTTLVKSGKTNSPRIVDWQSSSELSLIGITPPNSGTYFAVKVQGTFIPLETGTYTFSLESDDASDLTINGNAVIATYTGQAVPSLGTHTGTIAVTAGQKYFFEVRMQQGGGGYGLRLYWKSPTQNSTPSSYSSTLPANTYYQSWTQNLQEMVTSPDLDGSSSAKAAPSAKYLQNAFNNNNDGAYWINLPYVGPTKLYCLLSTTIDGGGWMMMMKATRGTTFSYSSSYWTSVNTLNPTYYDRADADSKFDAMNYFYAKDMMALWPDIASNYGSGSGGSVNLISSYNNWCWLQNNFNNGIRITPVSFFANSTKLFFRDASTFSGKGAPFSSQTDVRFYGYNYTSGNGGDVRWGFGWNENGGGLYPNGVEGSNDVTGGIGMSGAFTTASSGYNYSAGDQISCCQNSTGINRSARLEIYIR